jgi:hypothetical protein
LSWCGTHNLPVSGTDSESDRSIGIARDLKLADEVIITHCVSDECLHPADEGVERRRVCRWSKARCSRIASEDELFQPVDSVAATKEAGRGTVGVDLHWDRVVRPGGGSSLGDLLARALMEVLELDVGADLDRVLELVAEQAGEMLRRAICPHRYPAKWSYVVAVRPRKHRDEFVIVRELGLDASAWPPR